MSLTILSEAFLCLWTKWNKNFRPVGKFLEFITLTWRIVKTEAEWIFSATFKDMRCWISLQKFHFLRAKFSFPNSRVNHDVLVWHPFLEPEFGFGRRRQCRWLGAVSRFISFKVSVRTAFVILFKSFFFALAQMEGSANTSTVLCPYKFGFPVGLLQEANRHRQRHEEDCKAWSGVSCV
jgi:hypothetical protein